MTFGQGVSVTMVQMAAAFSATVNGGTYYQPTLIDGTLDQDGKETANQSKVVSDNVISDSASSNIRKMMFEARRGSWPTADGGYYVGSKTGTAQIYDDATKTYSKDRTTGTTIGFGADKDGNAQYVLIEHEGKQYVRKIKYKPFSNCQIEYINWNNTQYQVNTVKNLY